MAPAMQSSFLGVSSNASRDIHKSHFHVSRTTSILLPPALQLIPPVHSEREYKYVRWSALQLTPPAHSEREYKYVRWSALQLTPPAHSEREYKYVRWSALQLTPPAHSEREYKYVRWCAVFILYQQLNAVTFTHKNRNG